MNVLLYGNDIKKINENVLLYTKKYSNDRILYIYDILKQLNILLKIKNFSEYLIIIYNIDSYNTNEQYKIKTILDSHKHTIILTCYNIKNLSNIILIRCKLYKYFLEYQEYDNKEIENIFKKFKSPLKLVNYLIRNSYDIMNILNFLSKKNIDIEKIANTEYYLKSGHDIHLNLLNLVFSYYKI